MSHSKISKDLLDAAYRATAYVVDLPNGKLVLRINSRSSGLENMLAAMHISTWAFISASNPGSQRLEELENRSRHLKLVDEVQRRGFTFFEGKGIPDQAGWMPELSLLIMDIPQQKACALAASFGQNALLLGGKDGIPRLQYVHSRPEAI